MDTQGKQSKLWSYFFEISAIPRPSGNEKKIIAHLSLFAERNGFSYETDQVGNLLVKIPVSQNLLSSPGVILQSHVDMVCIGEPDPAKFGVKPIFDPQKRWLKTIGTTLGADNGIGMAIMMALAEEKFVRGPLALIFSVDEEKGLKGATGMAFKDSLKEFRYLINLDSEKESKVTIGCAGGGDSVITAPIKKVFLSKNDLFLDIEICGLLGGHSGVDIKEARLNAIKLLAELLSRINQKIGELKIVKINGGDARNVIPSGAKSTISFKAIDLKAITSLASDFEKKVKSHTLNSKERKFSMQLSRTKENIKTAITSKCSLNILNLLLELPHGTIKWSKQVKGLVQTSNNLAVVETKKNLVEISTMTRSSSARELESVRKKIRMIAEKFNAKVEQPQSYPGWQPRPESPLVKKTQEVYKKMYQKPIEVKAIHAGLECGVILGKYSHLQAISIGPNIENCHSIKERADVLSVERFYQFTKGLLSSLACV